MILIYVRFSLVLSRLIRLEAAEAVEIVNQLRKTCNLLKIVIY
jgi:hypothetical protein